MSDVYIRIYDNEFNTFIQEYDSLTNRILRSPSDWSYLQSLYPEFQGRSRESIIIERRNIMREILTNGGLEYYRFIKESDDKIAEILNFAKQNLKARTAELERQRKLQELNFLKMEYLYFVEDAKIVDKIEKADSDETLEAIINSKEYKDEVENVKASMAERTKKLEQERQEYRRKEQERLLICAKKDLTSKLIKAWNKDLINKINSCKSESELEGLKDDVLLAIAADDDKKREVEFNKLKKFGITKETDPDIFEYHGDITYLRYIINKRCQEKTIEIFKNLMKFEPKDLDKDIYIRTIDKRCYTDTETKNSKVFDIIELDIGVTYGFNIKEKMQFIKEEQKEIIKYCYYRIFKKFAITYGGGDLFFPIQYIKPTVYKASGIKATDTVNLCIIFELKRAKKNNQGE